MKRTQCSLSSKASSLVEHLEHLAFIKKVSAWPREQSKQLWRTSRHRPLVAIDVARGDRGPCSPNPNF